MNRKGLKAQFWGLSTFPSRENENCKGAKNKLIQSNRVNLRNHVEKVREKKVTRKRKSLYLYFIYLIYHLTVILQSRKVSSRFNK